MIHGMIYANQHNIGAKAMENQLVAATLEAIAGGFAGFILCGGGECPLVLYWEGGNLPNGLRRSLIDRERRGPYAPGVGSRF